MVCDKCGTEVTKKNKYCPKCGEAVNAKKKKSPEIKEYNLKDKEIQKLSESFIMTKNVKLQHGAFYSEEKTGTVRTLPIFIENQAALRDLYVKVNDVLIDKMTDIGRASCMERV